MTQIYAGRWFISTQSTKKVFVMAPPFALQKYSALKQKYLSPQKLRQDYKINIIKTKQLSLKNQTG